MLTAEKRTQLEALINQAEDNKETPEFIQNELIPAFKAKYDTPEPVKPEQANAANQYATQTEKYGVAGALFPATTESAERGGNFGSRFIAGAGDVLTLPARAVSAVATGAGTLAGGGNISTAAKEAANDLSRTKSDKEGALGFVQNMALDPTSSPLLAGAGVAARAAKAVPTIGKALLKTTGQGAAYGTGSSAYQQAKEGEVSPVQTIGQTLVGAGMGAAGTGLGKAVQTGTGKLLKNSAIRNIDISLRPGQYGRKIGYNHENVVKHDLVGSPRETYEKSVEKLNTLQARAKEIAGESDAVFDIDKMFEDVKRGLDPKNNPEEFARQIALIDEVKKSYIEAFGDVVDAPTAMKIRTKIGEKSAFVGRTSGGAKIDPDADWKEDVYNALYLKMKNDLHENLGGELKEINKAQSEIIPVKQVAERRMPISESNQRVGLSDLLATGIGQSAAGAALGAGAGAGYGAASGESGFENAVKGLTIGAALAGGRRALGSPAATKAFYKLGGKLNPETKAVPGYKKYEQPNRPTSKIDDSDPFEESLLTPQQFKEKQAAEKLQALQGEEIPEYNPEELLTPEEYAQKRHFEEMDKAYRGKDSGMQVRDEANSVKVGIRKSLGLPGSREIRMENLSPKKQAEINRYAADITANPMMRESFRDAGLIDANTERVHPDDVVRWMNESKKEKPSTIGDALKRTLGNERGSVGSEFKSNLSDDDLSQIANASDNMGYKLSIEDKKETMGPIISKLKKKGITHIDAYHIANGDLESIKKNGLRGSELDYMGKPSGNLRESSVYLFLDPNDIKKGQEYLKTSSKESPVVHIRIPIEKLTNLNWDSNFNLTSGSYTAERFSGNIPKDWIQGVYGTTIGDALKRTLGNKRGAVGGSSDSFVGTPAIRDPETGKIYLGGWRGHKDAITKGETSAIQERLKYQHFLDNSNKPTDNVGFIDKKGNFVSRSEAEAEIAKPKTPAQMYHGDEWGRVGSKKGDKYSALKTMAATGATAAGALTIGEAIKAKKKK